MMVLLAAGTVVTVSRIFQ